MNYEEILGKINSVHSHEEIAKAISKDCRETLTLLCDQPCEKCKTNLNNASKMFIDYDDAVDWQVVKIWTAYILNKVYATKCLCPNKIVWKDQNINRAFENAMYDAYEYENNLKKEINPGTL